MSKLQITDLEKSFGAHHVLRGVSLEVQDGEFLAVLGPSGCGKTTLLRCLAGFEPIDSGSIHIGGKRVAGNGTSTPAHQRQIAVVPQEGALFPHLNVAKNVGFGLGAMSTAERQRRVDECLELVGLPGADKSMPHELSGGMQQRVAVARALAPRPPLVLLDEPFSALDAALRVGLRQDIRAALAADQTTGVLVTHDQAEALSIADSIVVMDGGRVRQHATPQLVYRQPADEWVAGFVGEANILDVVGNPASGRVATVLGEVAVNAPCSRVMIRPEQVHLSPDDGPVRGRITGVQYHGHDLTIHAEVGGTPIVVRSLDRPAEPINVGDEVALRVDGVATGFPEG